MALLVTTPKVFCVNPTRPWTTLAQLTEAARAAPGRLLAGFAGNGSSLHIAIELWQQAAGVQVTHVPYRGAAPAVLDLIAGQIDLLIDNVPNILQQIRGGQARPLAVATALRFAQLLEVPTTSEAGLEGFRFGTWFGLAVPSSTPPAAIAALAEETGAAQRDPEIGGRFAELGAVPGPGAGPGAGAGTGAVTGAGPGGSAGFAAFLATQRAELEPVVRGAGMRAE